MALKLANLAISTLASSITLDATTLSIQNGDAGKFPVLTAGDWHPATIVDAAGNLEIVRVTARNVATLTVARAQEGTTAKAFAAGSRIDVRLTAGALGDMAGQSSNDVDITGGSVRGIEDLAIEDGGTGASNAADARNNLGLGNVNNTSDVNKPVSTAQQDALDQKADASDLAALTARTITGAGLATGGGDLSGSRTITVSKSTNAQAIAGTDDTTAMTPVRVNDAINSIALGSGQTWQTPARSVGSVYQNTTGRSIQVHVSAGRAGPGDALFKVSANNITWVNVAASRTSSSDGNGSVLHASIIIPPGFYYQVTGTALDIGAWSELRL